MKHYSPIGLFALILALAASISMSPPAHAAAKNQFHIKDGILVRGQNDVPFIIRGIETPALANPQGFSTLGLATALNRAAEVGANVVCFDLYGLSPDGTSLAPEELETIQTLIRQVNWRYMGAICKVLGANAPTEPKARIAAVRTVAKVLERDFTMLYWIDGPDAAKLAKEFKKAAPELLVIAPKGGDLTMGGASGPLSITLGQLPTSPETAHFLMPDGPATYETLDRALANPIELQPWTPDNSVLTDAERNDGWIALFDGKTLNGWTILGQNKQGFIAKDGAIQWNARGGGMLRTRDRYDDFIIRFEFQVAAKKNNGIQFHTPRAGRPSKIGFEFQIMGDHGAPLTTESTGSIYDVIPPKVDATNPDGEWNSAEITVQGPHVKAILNGQLVQDVNFDEVEELQPRLRRGFIVITDHGGYCAYRNLRLKKL